MLALQAVDFPPLESSNVLQSYMLPQASVSTDLHCLRTVDSQLFLSGLENTTIS